MNDLGLPLAGQTNVPVAVLLLPLRSVPLASSVVKLSGPSVVAT